MKHSTPKKETFLKEHWRGTISIMCVVVFPFLYYSRLIIPERSFSRNVCNDFVYLYYNYKVYLLDLLSQGIFPLWSPAEASGYPFYSNPFAQALYPLNIPLALFYKIFGGYSVVDHQAFSILGVAIFALGLYLWLNSLIFNHRAVMFATIVISASFKLGELLRLPNAIHTAAWIPWILYGITLAAKKEHSLKAAIILFSSCLMFLTGGYPYYVYYSLFLLPPYALLLFSLRIRDVLMPEHDSNAFSYKRYAVILLGASFGAFIVCAPYLYKMKQMLGQTAGRGGFDYEYAASWLIFSPIDTLGSFIFPPSALPEGWFYFSMMGVFLLLLYMTAVMVQQWTARFPQRFELFLVGFACIILFVVELFYGKFSTFFVSWERYIPGYAKLSTWGHPNIMLWSATFLLILSLFLRACWLRWNISFDEKFIILFLLWIGLLFYITYGKYSYLFDLLWRSMPEFSTLRVWARLNIILVPLFGLCVARAYHFFESSVLASMNHPRFLKVGLISVLGIGILAFQGWLYFRKIYNAYWFTLFFKDFQNTESRFIISTLLSFLILISLTLWASRKVCLTTRHFRIIFVLILLVALCDLYPIGSRQWTMSKFPIESFSHIHGLPSAFFARFTRRERLKVPHSIQQAFREPRGRFAYTISVTPFNVGVNFAEDLYFHRYLEFYKYTFPDLREHSKNAKQLQLFNKLMGIEDGKRIFLSQKIDYTSIEQFIADAIETEKRVNPTLQIIRYTGDVLHISLSVSEPVFLSFIDNWDPDWCAIIDGQETQIETLFGTFKSVRVDAGSHTLQFLYRPFFNCIK